MTIPITAIDQCAAVDGGAQYISILCTLKAQISGSLKAEIPSVPFHQQAVLLAGDAELHPVAAVHLKRHIVAGRGEVMVNPFNVIPVMPGHICALGYNCRRNGQSGGMVIFVPLSDALHKFHNHRSQYQQENNNKQDSEDLEKSQAGSKIIIHSLSFLLNTDINNTENPIVQTVIMETSRKILFLLTDEATYLSDF